MKLFITLYLFLFALLSSSFASAQPDDLLITSISGIKPWSAQMTQEVKIEISLPKGFHAYNDQFKILKLNPDSYSIGGLHTSPETEFFDKYTQKTRKGLFEKGTLSLIVEAAEKNVDPQQQIDFDLRYQICSESVCHLPQTLPIQLKVNSSLTQAGAEVTAPLTKTFSLIESIDSLLRTNLWLAFIVIFFAGVLTSFTPCIFPMLPITISILGYHADKNSRFKNFSRSLAYVLGIALTYSSLGVAAALTGSLFGSMLTNKYVLGALVILFFAMAFSMWGAFELQAPAFIRNRMGGSGGKSHNLLGAFIMGLVAGVVASPCVGPVLVSVLTYVSTTKNALLGFGLLFTFAMGLGLIFIVIGLFSSALKLLPKSGAWMEGIKFVLGAGMWGAALYYSQFLLPQRGWIALVSASFVALSIWKGAFNLKDKKYLKRSILLALFIFSSSILFTITFRPEYLTGNFYQVNYDNKVETHDWIPYSDEVLMQAEKQQKPVLVDFYADWCGACHELDEKTYSTDEFKQLSKLFVLVKFNATEDNEAIQAVLKKYDIKGLPTVLFINRNGVLLNQLTFTSFLAIDELKPKMQEALK